MIFTDIENKLIGTLSDIHEEFCQEGIAEIYSGVTKSLNILTSKNFKVFSKIERHLLNDTRLLYDNNHNSDYLSEKFEEAYKLSRLLIQGID